MLIQRVPESLAAEHRADRHPDFRELGTLAVYLVGIPGAADSFMVCRVCAWADHASDVLAAIESLDRYERAARGPHEFARALLAGEGYDPGFPVAFHGNSGPGA